ncbi:MAG TPA: hypothetical protein VES97_02955, partial [Solirubrobacteraceae bacterium]|nr:hypothetical protein [Solirubrobacteraceae bacterium]
MPGDARTLPIGDAPLGGAGTRRLRELRSGREGALAGADAGLRLGAAGLLAIVALSLLVVVMAADRPSLLSATTHANFFPRWMAGPLGGLWPGLTRNGTTLKYLFTGAIVVMYGGYLASLAYAPRLPLRWVVAAIGAVH